jgi:hypothetical protein
MSMRSKKSSPHANESKADVYLRAMMQGSDHDPRVIPCPACGLVDIDPEYEELCSDCEAEANAIEMWARIWGRYLNREHGE